MELIYVFDQIENPWSPKLYQLIQLLNTTVVQDSKGGNNAVYRLLFKVWIFFFGWGNIITFTNTVQQTFIQGIHERSGTVFCPGIADCGKIIAVDGYRFHVRELRSQVLPPHRILKALHDKRANVGCFLTLQNVATPCMVNQ